MPNVPVTVTGPKSLSGTTDANGCLFFGYLPQGNYTVAVTQSGNVDANGNSNISQQFGVNPAAITAAVIEYDVGASLNVSFSTRKAGVTVAGQKADQVSIGHSSLASPTWRTYDSNEPSDAPEAHLRARHGLPAAAVPVHQRLQRLQRQLPRQPPELLRPRAGAGVADRQHLRDALAGRHVEHHRARARRAADPPAPAGRAADPARTRWVVLEPETTWGGSPTLCSDAKSSGPTTTRQAAPAPG